MNVFYVIVGVFALAWAGLPRLMRSHTRRKAERIRGEQAADERIIESARLRRINAAPPSAAPTKRRPHAMMAAT